jgi:hypothetical protein
MLRDYQRKLGQYIFNKVLSSSFTWARAQMDIAIVTKKPV